MAVSLIPVLIVLALALLLVAGVVVLTKRQNRRVSEVERPTTATLRYRVPEGQDPLAVLTAVRQAGYDAATEGEVVVVTVPADSAEERTRVRSVIEDAGIKLEHETPPGNRVRFVDE